MEKSKERSAFGVFHSRVWYCLPDACILIQSEYEGNTRLSPEPKSNGRLRGWLNNEMALRREHLILSGPKTDLYGIFLAYKTLKNTHRRQRLR